MMEIKEKKNRGYIALMSVIIISSLLMLVVLGVSSNGFANRFNLLNTEIKKQSEALAEACVETARLKLAVDQTYTPPAGGEIISVGDDTCRIVSVADSGGDKEITIAAKLDEIYTNLVVKVKPNGSLDSWEETR